MTKVYIDFETRSQVNIKDTGAYRYIMDPSTEVMCAAYAIDDGPVKTLTWDELSTLEPLYNSPNNTFVAHNAFFEQCVMRKLFPQIKPDPRRWRCTAAKAAAASLPRNLEGVADALQLAYKKDMEGRRLMLKLARPRIPTEKNPSIWHEPTPEEYQKLLDYCATDVEVERVVDQALPDLIPSEQELWFLDQEINFRGVQVDTELVDAAIQVFGDYEKHLIEWIKMITKGELDGVSRIQAMTDWIEKRTGSRPTDLTKATVNALLESDVPEDVKQLLFARRTLGKTSVKKFHSMKASVNTDGRIRDLFMFHGAGTGRWSGKLVQLQNLTRGSLKDPETCIADIKKRDWELIDLFYPDVGEALSSCVRGALIAKEGHKLVVADYASIEARVLLWCAEDEAGLEKYRNGVDLYCDMASTIYKRPINKENKKERQLGKFAILSLGYGCGPNKFKDIVLVQGGEIDETQAIAVVNAYRSLYKKVTQHWRDMENAAKETINSGKSRRCGKVAFGLKKGFLIMQLPSGRQIVYYKPRITQDGTIEFMGVNSTTKQFEYQKTWGGVLVENEVQAISRDLLANGMFTAEKHGYPIIMHVHDELVAQVEENYGSYEEFEKLIASLPPWGQGIPLLAEGWEGKRYRK